MLRLLLLYSSDCCFYLEVVLSLLVAALAERGLLSAALSLSDVFAVFWVASLSHIPSFGGEGASFSIGLQERQWPRSEPVG